MELNQEAHTHTYNNPAYRTTKQKVRSLGNIHLERHRGFAHSQLTVKVNIRRSYLNASVHTNGHADVTSYSSEGRIRGLIIKFANLILEGLFTMNLYQLDKQSTKLTIWKYWKGCVKKLDGNDPNLFPKTHGSCITTMHLLTRHCLWGSF